MLFLKMKNNSKKNKSKKGTVFEICTEHPILSGICGLLIIFCVIPLLPLGYEGIIGFKKEPINWNNYISNLYSLVVTTTIALIVYLLVDKKTSDKIDEVKCIEKNIQKNTQNLSEITTRMQDNVNKIYFQTEYSIALNKYPDRKEFEKTNKFYQPFIVYLFDNIQLNICVFTQSNKQDVLVYTIEVIKDITGVPKVETTPAGKFYIIKIISPSYLESTTEEEFEKYKYSPIKEGEYYSCKFDERECSWILGERLELGIKYKDFYRFNVTDSSDSEWTIVRSANEVMGYNRNGDPGDEYRHIDNFIIDSNDPQNIISLFKKYNQVFYRIGNSPQKKYMFLENLIKEQQRPFLFLNI